MFQVGDEVRNYSTIYTVVGVVGNRVSVIDEQGQNTGGIFSMSSFTLAKPRLTGMTQFLKDTEKKYETLS